MTAPALTPARRAVLRAVADHLFPALGDMPAAGVIGTAGDATDRVLRAWPPLENPLGLALDTLADGEPANGLSRLRIDAPAQFEALLTVVAAAYFLSPQAGRAIGYEGQVTIEPRNYPFPDYLVDGTLDAVAARGPIYRPADARMEVR